MGLYSTLSREEYPLVSIIIPIFNEERYIEKCLQSVINLDWPKERMEIIVVDNGSTDSSVEIVKTILSTFENKRIVIKNSGTIASVRNHGWHISNGSVLAFLDGDSVVEKNWLKLGLQLLYSKETISCVGFASAPPLPGSSWTEMTWSLISSSGKRKGTQFVPWLSSFNLIVRRSCFEYIDGFDESLTTCEDSDLGNRLNKTSLLIFSDECHVRHLGTVKTIKEFMGKEYWRGQNSLDAWLKSPNKSSGWLICLIPFLYVFSMILSIILIPLGGLYLGKISLILIIIIAILPFILSIRSGVKGFRALLSTSTLNFFYLIARGISIVQFKK